MHHQDDALAGLTLRIGAALEARPGPALRRVSPAAGADRRPHRDLHRLAAPTVLPLAGRTDLVAIHLVCRCRLCQAAGFGQ